MVCKQLSPTYEPHTTRGLKLVGSHGDGYTMSIFWHRAYADVAGLLIGYNIYFSTRRENVFSEGVKFLSLNTTGLCTTIRDFTPGDMFYFAVRAMEYDPIWFNPIFLPDGEDGYDGVGELKVYPEAMLLTDISESSTVIPVDDIDIFPAFGVVVIGAEVIRYVAKDIPANNLIVGERGFLSTEARLHTVDGYDGYKTYDNALVRFFVGCEDGNNIVFQAQSKFSDPNFARTAADGYKEKLEDLLTSDLAGSDAQNLDFPRYDYAGWHRTDPDLFFKGKCMDSYIGGEAFCADGYNGVGRQIRGISLQDHAYRREEFLLERTGERCVFVRRLWKGIVCSCFESNREHPEHRCPVCFGTGFVTGYEQFFNPRRSDGNILVRFSPTKEDLKMEEGGLESTFVPDCWTLTAPAVKDRDFIIRLHEDGTEDFRYEILDVTRNKVLFGEQGVQKFTCQRVRKFDPINQWRPIRSTATMPTQIMTTVGMVPGPGGIAPHTHNLVISESIIALSQINQTTSVNPPVGMGAHNHPIVNGIVQEVLGHSHTIDPSSL